MNVDCLQMHFVILFVGFCDVYDVAGVTVNSVVDAREVFDMFVIALICLDFDLVFMRLVGV